MLKLTLFLEFLRPNSINIMNNQYDRPHMYLTPFTIFVMKNYTSAYKTLAVCSVIRPTRTRSNFYFNLVNSIYVDESH